MLSVFEQTYPFIEYIIIDGNSIDETVVIARSMIAARGSKPTAVISEPDRGIADAMNKGILLAKGHLVAHLHAGDRYIDEDTIERVVNSFLKESWRWGVAGSIVVDSRGREIHHYKPASQTASLLKKNSIPHQSTFLVKEIFDRNGLFSTDYAQAMDYEFWLRIVLKGQEKYTVLPFDTTYFLEGGRSSNTLQLLSYLYKLRKQLHEYQCSTNLFFDVLFLARVFLFSIFCKIKAIRSKLNHSIKWPVR